MASSQHFPSSESFATEACVVLDNTPCGSSTYITVASGKRVASQISVTTTFVLDTLEAFLQDQLGGTLTGVTLAVYTDNSGRPGARLGGTSSTLSTCYGGSEAQGVYGALASQLTLNGGSKYWVAAECAGSGVTYVCAAPSGSSVNFQKAGYNIGSFAYWTYSGGTWAQAGGNTWVVEVSLQRRDVGAGRGQHVFSR